jgi:branched-chain amino acid transport system ATP-binding protein
MSNLEQSPSGAAPAAGAAMLKARQITAEHGRIKVIHGVDLEVSSSEVLGLLGANGAGKSSLLGALAGTVRSSGSIVLDSRALDSEPAHRRADLGLAFVPEARRNTFNVLTTAENLDIGLQLTVPEKRAETLDFICELFPILRARSAVPAGMLSGGEQQMLAIGVALGRRPRALLLDEPTQGLAPAVFDILQEAMIRLRKTGVAIILAEQNLGFAARVVDRYIVLSQGRIVASGDRASMEDEERMSALYFGRDAAE